LSHPSEKWWSSSMDFGWHPIYEMVNKSHVWNHQPVSLYINFELELELHPKVPNGWIWNSWNPWFFQETWSTCLVGFPYITYWKG
jgi:hypothetical protein